MTFSFKNILVPVDLTINSEVAVRKAIELADHNASIHLLHVQNYDLLGVPESQKRYLTDGEKSCGPNIIERQLDRLKDKIEEVGNNIGVFSRIVVGDSVQKMIEKSARQLNIDVIIVGKNSHHSWLPFLNTVIPGQIAQRTGIAVFTVKPGAFNNKKVRSMVVPISSERVKNKMEIIAATCIKFRVKIYLVAFANKENDPVGLGTSSMLEVYQWIRSINCPVECALLSGYNKARAILNYSEKVNADIILVQPETETKIGWPNKHISDVLPFASKVQVWNV